MTTPIGRPVRKISAVNKIHIRFVLGCDNSSVPYLREILFNTNLINTISFPCICYLCGQWGLVAHTLTSATVIVHPVSVKYFQIISATVFLLTQGSIKFSHCAPMTSYGNVDHGQHWLRLWLVVWWHQAITWTDVDFSLTRFTTFTCDQLNSDCPIDYSDNEFENHNCEITTTSRRGTKFKCINANQELTAIYRLHSLCDMFALASLVWLHGDISNEHEGSELFTASTAFVWRRSRQVSMKVKWNYVFVAYHYLIVYYHVVLYHMVSYHISYHII